MSEFTIRPASISDAPYLAHTIIEAEKSNTNKLPYSTIFGLTEKEVHQYLVQSLQEEIDGCELSLSSYLVAESNGEIAASIGAWVEGSEGIPSSQIKGNLLNYVLPKECIEQSAKTSPMLKEMRIENFPNAIHLGAVYVGENFRGNRLLGTLMQTIINKLSKENPQVDSVYAHVFSCNTPCVKTFEYLNYEKVTTKHSPNKEIFKYLPSNKKYVFKKSIK